MTLTSLVALFFNPMHVVTFAGGVSLSFAFYKDIK